MTDPFDRENRLWLDQQWSKSRTLAPHLRRWYEKRLQSGASYAEVNKRVRAIGNRCWRFDLSLVAHDQEIQDKARALATRYDRIVKFKRFELERTISEFESSYGFSLPTTTNASRLCCPKFWRKILRKEGRQVGEQSLRELGLVHARRGAYVSDWGLKTWLQAQQRNRRILESMEAENEEGQTYTLAELSDLGISNPEYRRGELMVRMRGFEDYAKADSETNWQGVFYTWTCPSKYHVYSGQQLNPKYNDSSPTEAQEYLKTQWARARTALHKAGIRYFGFRIAEPHSDGCPHWHMILFAPEEDKAQLSKVLQDYAMAEDGDEPGAAEHRFKVVDIDPAKGGAAAYVAKYVAKNIDGHGVHFDEEANDYSAITALRVRAWASIWGIRQFQQVGGPPVTIYRECRRAANQPQSLASNDSEVIGDIILAADRADWKGFTEKMGGAACRRKDRPIQLSHFVKQTLGAYGDKVKAILGLLTVKTGSLSITRVHRWDIRFKSPLAEQLMSGGSDLRAPPALSLEYCQ